MSTVNPSSLVTPDLLSSQPSISFTKFERDSETLKTVKDYSKCYFPKVGEVLRNQFYLPLMHLDVDSCEVVDANDPHFQDKNTVNYLHTFTKMFKGEEEGVDPTFASFDKFKDFCSVSDVPVEIVAGDITYLCNVRIVQTKGFDKSSDGLRFVLFSFYGNKQRESGKVSSWDPKSLESMGAVPLEILQSLKSQMTVDSLMCFSLGGLTLDALKNIEGDVLPPTIIIDRALTSIKKAASKEVPFPLAGIVHYLASCYHLDANPESSFLAYLEKNKPLVDKKVIIIEAALDHFFSKSRGYNEDHIERIKKTGAEVLHGKFFVPYTHVAAHHALRKDWLFNNPNSGTDVENFIPMEPLETLASALNRHLTEDNKHTCFMVGGNRDTLDSLLYSCAPILESHISGKLQPK